MDKKDNRILWIKQIDIDNINDHINNTSSIMIKAYTIAQISYMDWIDRNKVRNDPNYIPVRIDSTQSRLHTTKGYTVKYIRIKELESYLKWKIKISFNW